MVVCITIPSAQWRNELLPEERIKMYRENVRIWSIKANDRAVWHGMAKEEPKHWKMVLKETEQRQKEKLKEQLRDVKE